MTHIVRGTALTVQLYARFAGEDDSPDLLLVGTGAVFSATSKSRLFIKTRFTQGFVQAGEVIYSFRSSSGPGGVYALSQLTLRAEADVHHLLRVSFLPGSACRMQWLYDGRLLELLDLAPRFRFEQASDSVITRVRDRAR